MKKIRFGVFGVGRGGQLVEAIFEAGAELVAICDQRQATIDACKKAHPICKDVAEFTDFEEFIRQDLDAVLLCNYFCDHTEYAIKCMRAGKHVLSETMSNVTMAEGVALCRAVEETGMTYALFENYPNFVQNLEMKKLYSSGELGHIVYGEGEYAHPIRGRLQNMLAPGEKHWRNRMPRAYYVTHTVAPLMFITDSMPTRVTAMTAFQPESTKGTASLVADAANIILCETDTNAIFRMTSWGGYFPLRNHFRICCTEGGADTEQFTGKMQVVYNPECIPEGRSEKNEYTAEWPDNEQGRIAAGKIGNGGADFFTVYDFVKNLEEGTEPYWNVYRATATASVGILAWRSILEGKTYDIPDFRKEEDRIKYENDDLTPFPDEDGNTTLPSASRPYTPSAEDIDTARKQWIEMGYNV